MIPYVPADAYFASSFLESIAVLTIFAVVGLVLLTIMTPFVISVALLRKGANRYMNTRGSLVIASYDPPRNLRPAELGFLYDLQCDNKEILATLFDLEQRGVISMLTGGSVRIINQMAYDALEEFEKVAVQIRIPTASGGGAVNSVIKDIGTYQGIPSVRLEFSGLATKSNFTRLVQKSLASKGIKTKGYTVSFIQRAFVLLLPLLCLPLLFAGTSIEVNGVMYDPWSVQSIFSALIFTLTLAFFTWPFGLVFSSAVLWIFTKFAGRVWLANKSTRAIWPEIEGYRLFLKTVDIDNIQFESKNSKDQIVTKTLPYAMVLNLETFWKYRLNHLGDN